MVTWTISQLERNTADGGITVAHWRVMAEETVGEGENAVVYSASSYGTAGFTPDATADGFVPFENLTEASVLAWVHDSVDKDSIEASLAERIESQKNPVTQAGLPW